MGKMSVKYGTKAKYSALATKDADTLYFCTDTGELFKGSVDFSQAVRFVSEVPTAKAQGVLYVLTSGEIKCFDGTDVKTVAYPYVTTGKLSSSSTAAQVPVAKVVWDTIADYAPLASPDLTGTPTAPTAAAGTSTTQIATTAFVKTACDAISQALSSALEFKGVVADMAALAAIVDPSYGDVYQVTNAGTGKSNAEFVYVEDDGSGSAGWVELGTVVDLSGYAPLASPVFTGTPEAPTAAKATDSTQIATTAFVHDVVDDYAPLNSPDLTGTPTAPTATAGDSSTQLATTAFVATAISNFKTNVADTAYDAAGSAAAAETAAKSYADGLVTWEELA